jgi:hypothetical protein
MKGTLLASLLCLALWIVFGFVRPVGLGVIHLLWPAAAVLWVRWWALTNELGQRSTVNGQR